MERREANWNDAEDKRLEPGFYKHISSGDIIELNITAAGFHMNYGIYGQNRNIFDLSKLKKYRRMTNEEIEREIRASSAKRAAWFKSGLAGILKAGKEKN